METFNAFQMQNWLKFSYGGRWNVMVIITDLFKNILWKSAAFINGEGPNDRAKAASSGWAAATLNILTWFKGEARPHENPKSN